MNGCVWQETMRPLHPSLSLPPFLDIRKEGTDIWAVVSMILQGYGNEHVKQKETWTNYVIDNKYVNK